MFFDPLKVDKGPTCILLSVDPPRMFLCSRYEDSITFDYSETATEVIKNFTCSNQLSMKF